MRPQLTLVGGTSVAPTPAAIAPSDGFVDETYSAKNEGGDLPWVIRASEGRIVAKVLTEQSSELILEKLRGAVRKVRVHR